MALCALLSAQFGGFNFQASIPTSMKSYQSIKAEIAKLEKQAEALRVGEQRVAVARVKKLMDEFGLTLADLGGAAKGKPGRPPKAAKSAKSDTAVRAKKAAKGKPASIGAPKYRDPKSQKTWTGRGKPPLWIVGVKNRDALLIDAPAAAPAAKKSAAPVKAKAVAKAAQPAKAAKAPKATKAPKAAKAPAKKAAAQPAPTVKAVVKRAAKKAAKSAPAAAAPSSAAAAPAAA